MKTIHFRDAEGKTLKLVYDCDHGWQKRKTRTKVPDSSKLFNFDVNAGDKRYLVLDPYGDEILTKQFRRKLFMDKGKTSAVAIDRDTGEVGMATFYVEKKLGHVMSFWRFGGDKLRVPKKFLSRLDELKSKKRPFRLSVDESALILYIDREVGWEHLRAATTVYIHFDDPKGKKKNQSLQLRGELWRLVSDWDIEER